MRVIYIARFDKPHGYERCVAYAMRRLGAVVVEVPYNSSYAQIVSALEGADFVLFSKTQPRACRQLLWECSRRDIPTVCWCWDLYWGLREVRPTQFNSDLLLTTDGGHQEAFEKAGYTHQVLRQGIHAPEAVAHARSPKHRFSHDVAFVGGAGHGYHPSRTELVQWLGDTYGEKFTWIRNTYGLALNRLLSKVKVVVGDSYPTEHGHYWSNRVYEITGRGGVLIHPHVAGLANEFDPCREIPQYSRGNYGDLRLLLEGLLEDGERREAVRAASFQRCRTEYTYERRVETLLKIVSEKFDLDTEELRRAAPATLPR